MQKLDFGPSGLLFALTLSCGAADSSGKPSGRLGNIAKSSPSVNAEPNQQATLVVSRVGSYFETARAFDVVGATPDLVVEEDDVKQAWLGMGGTFNEKGWDNLTQLSPADQERALRLLFGADGARFNHGRIPIGANDYALTQYTLAETPGDYAMEHFSIEHDRGALIPYIKAALTHNPDLHFWASPWTPPAWMKLNNALDCGPVHDEVEVERATSNVIINDDQVLKAHALYLARFVEEYGKEGIRIEAVHPQNEPGFHANHYPSCGWDAPLLIRYITDFLGPTFEERKVPAQIWAGTLSSDLFDPNRGWFSDIDTGHAIAADASAMKYVKGFGLQWNTAVVIPDAQALNVPVAQTEHRSGNYPWVTSCAGLYRHCSVFDEKSARNDHAYAQQSWDLIRDWINAGVNSYMAWNIILDTIGQGIDMSRSWPQESLLIVDRKSKTLITTPAYYVFRHVSGFVDPGAHRLGVTGPAAGDSLAFKNQDGSIVVIMYNDATSAVATTVGFNGGPSLRLAVPAQGWATLRYN